MGIKQFVYNISVHGLFRPLAKPVYTGLTNLVLWKEQLLDISYSIEKEQDFINKNLTALIKTFERPEVLKRLVKSLRKMYPGMRVIIVDDSRKPMDIELEGVDIIVMSYDSGVSAGRNKALKYVQTRYLMLLDDDFIFYRYTKVGPVLKKLEQFSEIDIVGGDVIHMPFYRKTDYKDARLYPTDATSIITPGNKIDDMIVYDKVANFYIARTESSRRVGWDAKIKRLDHADFFTRAKGKLVTVFDPKFKILHARTPFDKAYMQKRLDVELDRKILWLKYYSKNHIKK
jgi:glycosyltransferase involved in cell wall biosynthesis